MLKFLASLYTDICTKLYDDTIGFADSDPKGKRDKFIFLTLKKVGNKY